MEGEKEEEKMETQTRKKLVSHGVQTVLACSSQNISDYLLPIYYKCNVNKCHSQSKYWPYLRRQLVDDQTMNWWSIVVERLNLLEAFYERPFEGVPIYIGNQTRNWWSIVVEKRCYMII